ncbi:MAG TPA: monofunctional biosynthetic peptidoglycan transglycosylase [Terriglobales bacterium]|nr:monofunctional biosynthetic peptidoglycan transglycosylase [Terriglobales bacterium]
MRSPRWVRRRQQRRPRRTRRWPARLVTGLAGLLLAFYLACTLLLVAYRWIDPPLTTVQLQRCLGSLLGPGSLCGRPHFVPLDQMSPHLGRAVIAAEDARFYQHHGVDWQALQEAAEANQRRAGKLRGGSTITQQLVKNLFLTAHQRWLRKALELPLALLADAILPKQRILELYLNVIEWGPGVYGAERAARYHYHRPSAALSRAQAARLAAILPSPQRRKPERMDRYSELILRRMR